MQLGRLGKLTNLKELSLKRCSQVTNEGMKQLVGMTNLKFLDLSNCRRVIVEDAEVDLGHLVQNGLKMALKQSRW